MRLLIPQQDLLPALQTVSRSCGIRSTLPVLANILLQAEGDNLILQATNLEVGIIKRLKTNIQEDGSTTIPAKILLEVVSSLPPGPISFESVNDQLKITTHNFSVSINGIPSSEFPAIPISSENSIQIDSGILKSLPQITFAAAIDEGRPILTGILTEIKDSSLELIATDGFRLAHKTAKLSEEKIGLSFRSLIPRRTYEEIVRLVSEDPTEPQVNISTSENQNQLIFKIGTTELSSRLIEGTFPSWEKIIPTQFENKTEVKRDDLLKGLKLASIFARGEANIVKLLAEENKLILTSEAKELGSQKSDVEAKTEGTPILIAFNNKFLIDVLSSSNAEKILIEFSGNLSPTLIKPIGEEGLEYVIMPIRLN